MDPRTFSFIVDKLNADSVTILKELKMYQGQKIRVREVATEPKVQQNASPNSSSGLNLKRKRSVSPTPSEQSDRSSLNTPNYSRLQSPNSNLRIDHLKLKSNTNLQLDKLVQQEQDQLDQDKYTTKSSNNANYANYSSINNQHTSSPKNKMNDSFHSHKSFKSNNSVSNSNYNKNYQVNNCRNQNCCICLKPIECELAFALPCNHLLHWRCMEKSLKTQGFKFSQSNYTLINTNDSNQESVNLNVCFFCPESDCHSQLVPSALMSLLSISIESGHTLLNRKNSDQISLEYRNLLQYHYLSKTVLQEIPDIIFNFRNIMNLDINGQLISKIPKSISKFSQLKRLGLVSCCLTSLEAHVALESLEEIIVKGNQITTVSQSLFNLNKMFQVYLASNRISTLPEFSLKGLTMLKLNNNLIVNLPMSLYNCSNLTKLELMGNKLISIHADINKLLKLKELYLQGNNLEMFPSLQLNQLKWLFIQDNSLTKLNKLECQQLEWLYAYNNKIEALEESILQDAPIRRMFVENNPINNLDNIIFKNNTNMNLSVIGIDYKQKTRILMEMDQYRKSTYEFPKFVSIGLCDHSIFYSKFFKNESIKEKEKCLIVAFAASQGQPEWGNMLLNLDSDKTYKNCSSVKFDNKNTFQSFAKESTRKNKLTDLHLVEAVETVDEKNLLNNQNYSYDVLLLCDTHMNWYFNSTEFNSNTIYQDLRSLIKSYSKDYNHTTFIGSSMGAFAALSNCDLADLVIVFNPQVDLCRSSLRPGLEYKYLQIATENIKHRINNANENNNKIFISCGLDEHQLQIRENLDLSKIVLMVHPFLPTQGLSRHLNNAGLLDNFVYSILYNNMKHSPGSVLSKQSNLWIVNYCSWGSRLLKVTEAEMDTLNAEHRPRSMDWVCSVCSKLCMDRDTECHCGSLRSNCLKRLIMNKNIKSFKKDNHRKHFYNHSISLDNSFSDLDANENEKEKDIDYNGWTDKNNIVGWTSVIEQDEKVNGIMKMNSFWTSANNIHQNKNNCNEIQSKYSNDDMTDEDDIIKSHENEIKVHSVENKENQIENLNKLGKDIIKSNKNCDNQSNPNENDQLQCQNENVAENKDNKEENYQFSFNAFENN